VVQIIVHQATHVPAGLTTVHQVAIVPARQVRLAPLRQEVVALEAPAHQVAEAVAVEDNISHTLKDNKI
jgi:hypothetical protein